MDIRFTLRTAAKSGTGGTVKRKSNFERRRSAITIRNTQSGKSHVILPLRIQTNVRHASSWTAGGNARAQKGAAVFRKMKHHFTVNVPKEIYGRLRLHLILQTSAVSIWTTFKELCILLHSVFMCFVWISEQTENISPYSINLLRPTGQVMHQQFNTQQLYALPTLYLCVLYLSENKQRLVPLTA